MGHEQFRMGNILDKPNVFSNLQEKSLNTIKQHPYSFTVCIIADQGRSFQIRLLRI